MKNYLTKTVSLVIIFFIYSQVSANFDTGKEFVEQGEYDSAIKEFQKIKGKKQLDAAAPYYRKVLMEMFTVESYRKLMRYDGNTGKFAQDFKWIKSVAVNGNADAQFVLGHMYINGYGIEKNTDEALKWYQKSAENGDQRAQYHCGELLLSRYKKYEQAIGWVEKAADQGNVDAMVLAAWFYLQGIGVKQDRVKSFRFFEKAAKQAHSSAQMSLCRAYEYGYQPMVKQDTIEALAWCSLAARLGDPEAIREMSRIRVQVKDKDLPEAKKRVIAYWRDYVVPFQKSDKFVETEIEKLKAMYQANVRKNTQKY